MDRYIDIQKPLRVANEFNEDEETWVSHARVWAEAVPLRATERFESSAVRQVKEYTFRLRYRKGVTPDMRIQYENEFFRIKGIAEVGRRHSLEISAEYMEATNGY